MPDLQWFAFTDRLVAWLLTYAVHSTLLLAGAWLVSSKLSLAAREMVWKSAVIGGFLTATLQLATGQGMSTVPQWIVVPSSQTMLNSAASPLAVAATALTPAQGPAPATHPAAVPPVSSASQGRPWKQGLALAWGLLAAAALLLLTASYRRLRHRLADRAAIVDGPAHGLLESLRRRCGLPRAPHLSRSRALTVPIARGALRPEICLPERALSLAEDHQESLLAHELAHLLRRDPAWLVLNRVLESTFFFQPLNFVARRHLQEIAEFRCDDLAARWTGRPEALARCLTEVAGWSVRGQQVPAGALAPSMAVRRQSLRQRVCRLLDFSSSSSARASWWLRPALGAGLLAFAMAAPGVSPADGAPSAPQAPEAIQAPEPAPEPAPAPQPSSPPEPLVAPAVAGRPVSPVKPGAPPAAPRVIPRHTVTVPEVRIPEVRVPEFRVPEIKIPEIRIPEIHMPELDIYLPEINMPALTIPEMVIPEIEIPEIHMPELDIEIPEIEIPDIHLEGLGEVDTAQLEASLAELRAVTASLEDNHMELMKELERTFEETIGPALEEVHEIVNEELDVHLEQLEREIRDARDEGNPEREEALRNVQEELRTALLHPRSELLEYQETVEEATAVYHRELAERHQRLVQEQAAVARAELARARETMREEIALNRAERERTRAELGQYRAELQHHRETQREALREQMAQRAAQQREIRRSQAREQAHRARAQRNRAREQAREQSREAQEEAQRERARGEEERVEEERESAHYETSDPHQDSHR